MENKIKSVRARIKFVEMLTSERKSFSGLDKIEYLDQNQWTHPYVHFSGLRFYLLLTCFDILGSNDSFVKFNDWLKASKYRAEREKIFPSTTEMRLTNDNIYDVYAKYNEKYGVVKSFKRFVMEKMTEKDRTRLFSSIEILKINRVTSEPIIYEPLESEKIKFLLMIRNDYTHMGKSHASPVGGVFEEEEVNQSMFSDLMHDFETVYIEKKVNFCYVYRVKRWPKLLMEVLESTLDSIETRQSYSVYL